MLVGAFAFGAIIRNTASGISIAKLKTATPSSAPVAPRPEERRMMKKIAAKGALRKWLERNWAAVIGEHAFELPAGLADGRGKVCAGGCRLPPGDFRGGGPGVGVVFGRSVWATISHNASISACRAERPARALR